MVTAAIISISILAGMAGGIALIWWIGRDFRPFR